MPNLSLGLIVAVDYDEQNLRGKALLLTLVADASTAIQWSDLGLHPVALEIGALKIRWYSLAYISGIVLGWWYLAKLAAQPGSPLAKRHVDDFVFYATLGIILGGRIGYVLFYRPSMLANPVDVFKLWEGGMSFHGGVLGVLLAITWLVRKEKLNWLRVCDYVACAIPFGMFFGRIANFVNGELWGRETDVAWGMVFPEGGPVVRHPSQLYEGSLEGLLLGIILWVMFWKTDARYYPGRLVGIFATMMGIFRFIVEYFREPDAGVYGLGGLSMGQTLSIPLIMIGLYVLLTSKGRRQRVEPVAGSSSVA
jgi:phosphatidylglycerol:prolipoprotein diacylglycerol transferase